MISAKAAISKARQDRVVLFAMKCALAVGVAYLVVSGSVRGTWAVALVAAIWMFTSVHGARRSREAGEWPHLIAAGRYDEAEKQIESALNTFTTFWSIKVLGLHHLAMLRHAQRRFSDAAALCQAVLSQRLHRLPTVSHVRRQASLVLADSLLELNDLPAAAAAINSLFAHRLALPEALNLLRIQTDYLSRIGAWEQAAAGIERKVEMAELMPAASAVRTQALLALAAKKTGRGEWEGYLRRRVELLGDVNELVAWRAGLAELWASAGEGPQGAAVQ